MDNDSKIGIRLLETIGGISAKLVKFSIELKKRSDVLSTENNLECRTYPESGTVLDFYLDAELKNGNCINYFLGLRWSDRGWVISARISINDEQGYKVLKDFQDRQTENFEELLTSLVFAASELSSSSVLGGYTNKEVS